MPVNQLIYQGVVFTFAGGARLDGVPSTLRADDVLFLAR